MLNYVSQLRYKQGACNIATRAGFLDGRGRVIWAGEKSCFEPIADPRATCFYWQAPEGRTKLEQLLEFAWHDVGLLHIELDRSNPGNADTVRMIVEWAEWQPRPPARRSIIEFTGCYRLEAAMNFGFVCYETILQAGPEPDHAEIVRIRAWSGLTDLFCWVFETNSTGSLIKIIARGVTVRPLT